MVSISAFFDELSTMEIIVLTNSNILLQFQDGIFVWINKKRAMMALYRSPEYHSTQEEYDLIGGTFLSNYFEIRP